MAARLILTPGEQLGRLTYVREAPTPPGGMRRVILRCICGSERSYRLAAWRHGSVISCGCANRDALLARATHHGQARVGKKTPLYVAWVNMRARCGPNGKPGYRDVEVDPRWSTFEGFMAHPPVGTFEPGMVLGRFGDAGDYTPTNARWITKSQNSREANERKMLRLPDGRLAADVAAANGLPRSVWDGRLRRGWEITRAVTEPKGRRWP